MSLTDVFTSDGTVEMKHGEYYKLMKEAAKAELTANAVKADVPSYYINAMFTGKLEFPKFEAEETPEAMLEKAAEEWGALTTAIKNVLESGKTPEEVKKITGHICEIVETISQVRKEEISEPIYRIRTHISGEPEEIHKVLECMRNKKSTMVFGCGENETEQQDKPKTEAAKQKKESEEFKDGNE